MKTWLRLIGMAGTFAALFALSWLIFVRERPQPVPAPLPKTTAELLIGRWEVVEQDPPPATLAKVDTEFTRDGKEITWVSTSDGRAHPPITGVYQLSGDTIRCDLPEDVELKRPHQTSISKIQLVTRDTLIVTGTGMSDGIPYRVVYRRTNGD